ncbi:sll6052 (plasmid) [Synechocystis sp. PCC 6803]|uniref:Sll6052 protein n=2 Tax=unclassified Synechocystis TaxID=2640012 RepID=Q6YRV2_SYNY3|nr:DUF6527 family protein [Synechocystis sp. PCC 6803]AGF53761.1 hypothetical protein MYO_3530 [Synechocystis sp. PCC 6803]AVP91732.1 hypothetical protein C7I86_18365 [Synechocystis sp. IPPAS B-1465]MCW5242013.1 hypothetical protein [Synechocystis sp. PCC 6803]BAD02109.1 sll6052 [Synechocystis sp. PCC 6803]
MLNRFWVWFKLVSRHSIMRWFLVKLGFLKKSELTSRMVNFHPAPEEIMSGEVVIVGDRNHKKWACFRCPSGCGELILLSLNKNQHPSWRVDCDWLNRPTLHPSVRQLNHCQCHFWIKRGVTQWCADSRHNK